MASHVQVVVHMPAVLYMQMPKLPVSVGGCESHASLHPYTWIRHVDLLGSR